MGSDSRLEFVALEQPDCTRLWKTVQLFLCLVLSFQSLPFCPSLTLLVFISDSLKVGCCVALELLMCMLRYCSFSILPDLNYTNSQATHDNIKFIGNMYCLYCQHQQPSLARSYNIENVNQRFIPTYFHTQIFAPIDSSIRVVGKCTPTFHSQILRHQHGTSKGSTAHFKRAQSTKQQRKDCSKDGRLHQFSDAAGNTANRSNELWYDSAKQDLHKKLQCCARNYSHQRKQVDLSSNPVFGGTTLDIDCCNYHCQPAISEEQPRIIIEQPAKEVERKELIDYGPTIDVSQQAEMPKVVEEKVKLQEQKKTKKPLTVPKGNALKKTAAFSQTVIEGRPSFTVVRRRQ